MLQQVVSIVTTLLDPETYTGPKLKRRKRHCHGMRDFEVSKALKISVVVFWVVTPYILISG
jgi:hypothetical protein